jgi:phosphatidylinositol kinase/protein kinase (PI-3  family)
VKGSIPPQEELFRYVTIFHPQGIHTVADQQWLPVWAPVPPVSALVYFHPRYGNHPLILQYAMRVLEQHPVDLTFFFVPQCVQALRSDGLGYVERFIFETSKISQLFCHQIIWNMKANTYKDDDAVSYFPQSNRKSADSSRNLIR